MTNIARNTICLWFDGAAEDAARFYAATFPDSSVGAVYRAPGDFPSGKQGDVLTVSFTVMGIPCLGLNGGPEFRHSEAFSFQVATDNQAETDRYWNAIVGNGGEESACGWCKDKWGVNWQITPRVLTDAMAAGGETARRAFEAALGKFGPPGDQNRSLGLDRIARPLGRNGLGGLLVHIPSHANGPVTPAFPCK